MSDVISVTYPLEKLVIWIIQKQDDLDRFKKNSLKRLNLLKQIVSGYTKQEQKEVMDYMRSNGRIKAYETIDFYMNLSILTVLMVLGSTEKRLLCEDCNNYMNYDKATVKALIPI
ncbi:hypothetical protein [Staphylococcus sp. AS1337]|uniref:hypothetical protein n=1 Tax=Staphylococcus sp. AS1337 TaxID=3434042 RepID=UPI003F57E313